MYLQGFVTSVCASLCLDGCTIWCQQPVVIFYQVASSCTLQECYSLVTTWCYIIYALVLVLYNHVSLSSSVSKNNDKFGSYMYEYIV